jgi:four helix bundle protein
MDLKDLRIYNQSMELGEMVWNITCKWDFFAKDTVGKQFIRSVDSIAANISEGFGRYHFKENRNFLYYARGSLYETQTWVEKSLNRNLISKSQYNEMIDKLKDLGIKLNNYIKTIGKT